MITNVLFADQPIAPGERRPLAAWSDAEPLFLAIQCFRQPPTPPKLTDCKECGTFIITSGAEVMVEASQTLTAGYLYVEVHDASGDRRAFTLEITARGGAQAYVRATY
jgi:hypothetical protein